MTYPNSEWEAVDAEALGWSRTMLEAADDAASQFGVIATVTIHHGQIVASRGDIAEKVLIRSMRKSLLSAWIGIEVERGTIRLGETMADLGIDDIEPALSDAEKLATVEDLLKARSGIYHEAVAEDEAMKKARPQRGIHSHGTHWYYNNWDFNALGTIYEQATGKSVFDAFRDEIAGPVGMQDFSTEDCYYYRASESSHPAYHFEMSARDLARFGWLCCNKGRWLDQQIVPAGWIERSTEAHSTTDDGFGYGYMWWTTGHDGSHVASVGRQINRHLPKFRFFARGAYGQMIAILPEIDLVCVALSVSRERSADEIVKLGDFLRLSVKAMPLGHSAD
jgi:CubicO group peptidase (beta-lactamase class C family)